MRCVGGRGLSRASTAEHALEDGQTIVVRDNLLQSDRGDVQFGTRGRHVRVTLVGADNDVARLGNAEVGTCHSGIGRQELIA